MTAQFSGRQLNSEIQLKDVRKPVHLLSLSPRPSLQSSSTSSQDDEKSTLEEVSEGAIPIDQPTQGPSTPGSQGPELPFQSHSGQSQSQGLNKSSSSPELQTLPEAFSVAATESSTAGHAARPRAPSDGKPQQSQVAYVEREGGGTAAPGGGETTGPTGPGQAAGAADGPSGPHSGTAAMSLELPSALAYPGPISPSGGHRPRGHTISVSAPSSRRERRSERDSYRGRAGPTNAEKTSGLSPRYREMYSGVYYRVVRTVRDTLPLGSL